MRNDWFSIDVEETLMLGFVTLVATVTSVTVEEKLIFWWYVNRFMSQFFTAMKHFNIVYSDYLILWLWDTVTYCFLWLFSRFPFPNALFYTDAISDTVTLPYLILWLFFIKIWGESVIFFAIFYLVADIFSFWIIKLGFKMLISITIIE